MYLPQIIINNIQSILQDRGLTQEQLAALIGVSPEELFQDSTLLYMKKLERIADVLKVPASQLLQVSVNDPV